MIMYNHKNTLCRLFAHVTENEKEELKYCIIELWHNADLYILLVKLTFLLYFCSFISPTVFFRWIKFSVLLLLHSVQLTLNGCLNREPLRVCTGEELEIYMNEGARDATIQYGIAIDLSCGEYSDGNTGTFNFT